MHTVKSKIKWGVCRSLRSWLSNFPPGFFESSQCSFYISNIDKVNCHADQIWFETICEILPSHKTTALCITYPAQVLKPLCIAWVHNPWATRWHHETVSLPSLEVLERAGKKWSAKFRHFEIPLAAPPLCGVSLLRWIFSRGRSFFVRRLRWFGGKDTITSKAKRRKKKC